MAFLRSISMPPIAEVSKSRTSIVNKARPCKAKLVHESCGARSLKKNACNASCVTHRQITVSKFAARVIPGAARDCAKDLCVSISAVVAVPDHGHGLWSVEYAMLIGYVSDEYFAALADVLVEIRATASRADRYSLVPQRRAVRRLAARRVRSCVGQSRLRIETGYRHDRSRAAHSISSAFRQTVGLRLAQMVSLRRDGRVSRALRRAIQARVVAIWIRKRIRGATLVGTTIMARAPQCKPCPTASSSSPAYVGTTAWGACIGRRLLRPRAADCITSTPRRVGRVLLVPVGRAPRTKRDNCRAGLDQHLERL